MLKLHYIPESRAMRPRWLLEELGVPYELMWMVPRRQPVEPHPNVMVIRSLSPVEAHRGPLDYVPALTDGGTMLIESTAIIMHLADRFPEKGLAPAPGTPDRGLWYQWIVYAMVTVEPQVLALSNQLRLQHQQMFLEAEGKIEPPEGLSELVEQKAKERFCQAVAVLEKHLASREFLVGDRFSAADVVMGAVLGWGRQLVRLRPDFPNCCAYIKAMLGRPAAKKALED